MNALFMRTRHSSGSLWFDLAALMFVVAVVTWVRLAAFTMPALDVRAQQLAVMDTAEQIYANSNRSTNRGIAPEVLQAVAREQHLWYDRGQALAEELRAQRSHLDDEGNQYTFLYGYDSYYWLRLARNLLETGTDCDDGVPESCRNTYASAPVGQEQEYKALPHIQSLVGLHKAITAFSPDYPLAASANVFSLILALVTVLPAFYIGKRLAGIWGAISVSVLLALGSVHISRTLGIDTDAWNVLCLLTILWLLMESAHRSNAYLRLFLIACAGIATGFWATIWSGWLLGFSIVSCFLVFTLVADALNKSGGNRLAGNLWALLSYWVGCWVSLQFGPADINLLAVPMDLYQRLLPTSAVVSDTLNWPNNLLGVSELAFTGLPGLVASTGGFFLFVLSLSGASLLAMESLRERRKQDWLLAAGSVACLGVLLLWLPQSKWMGIALISLPLCLPILYKFRSTSIGDDALLNHGVLLVITSLACFWLAYDSQRFLLLSWIPMAIFLGVSISYGCQWLWALLEQRRPNSAWVMLPLGLFVAITAYAAIPGVVVTHNLIPVLNRSTQQALLDIREKTSEEAIITGLWDFGYWAQYYAQRRTSTDGGTLLNRSNYWVNRALTSEDERESVGLLRMLNCGSDASHRPEAKFAALERLKETGLTEEEAFKRLLELVRLDRTSAEELLRADTKTHQSANDILDATHCDPPESILLTSAEQIIKSPYWVGFGLMDPLDPEASVGDSAQYQVVPRWLGCSSTHISVPDLGCPVPKGMQLGGEEIRFFSIQYARPETARVELTFTGAQAKLGLILIAESDHMRKIEPKNPDLPKVGVLVDRTTHQILLGHPDVLKSLYTQLQLLDGRYTKHFEKVTERSDKHGDTMMAWRVKRWE